MNQARFVAEVFTNEVVAEASQVGELLHKDNPDMAEAPGERMRKRQSGRALLDSPGDDEGR